MIAGPPAIWEQVRPLLEVFGKPFFMGANPGAGQTMKLVNNLLGACAIAITAEGMTLGDQGRAGSGPHDRGAECVQRPQQRDAGQMAALGAAADLSISALPRVCA